METIGNPPQKRFSLLNLCLCTCIFLSQWECVTAGEGKKNETNTERYPLVVFDFERVELPFVICLWVLIASLAKIGKTISMSNKCQLILSVLNCQ